MDCDRFRSATPILGDVLWPVDLTGAALLIARVVFCAPVPGPIAQAGQVRLGPFCSLSRAVGMWILLGAQLVDHATG